MSINPNITIIISDAGDDLNDENLDGQHRFHQIIEDDVDDLKKNSLKQTPINNDDESIDDGNGGNDYGYERKTDQIETNIRIAMAKIREANFRKVKACSV